MRSQNNRKKSKKTDGYEKIQAKAITANKVVRAFNIATLLSWLMHVGGLFARILGELAYAIPLIRAVVDGFRNIWFAAGSWFKQEDKYTKRVRIFTGTAGFSLMVATVALVFLNPALILAIAAAATIVTLIREAWFVGIALFSRLWGRWLEEKKVLAEKKAGFYKLLKKHPDAYQALSLSRDIIQLRKKYAAHPDLETEFILAEKEVKLNRLKKIPTIVNILGLDEEIYRRTNAERKRQADLSSKTHELVLTVLGLAGTILLFTPAAPAGAAILIATAVYGLFHHFDWPAKWASRLSNYFYGPQELDSVKSIQEEQQKAYPEAKKEISLPEHYEPSSQFSIQKNQELDILIKKATPSSSFHLLDYLRDRIPWLKKSSSNHPKVQQTQPAPPSELPSASHIKKA